MAAMTCATSAARAATNAATTDPTASTSRCSVRHAATRLRCRSSRGWTARSIARTASARSSRTDSAAAGGRRGRASRAGVAVPGRCREIRRSLPVDDSCAGLVSTSSNCRSSTSWGRSRTERRRTGNGSESALRPTTRHAGFVASQSTSAFGAGGSSAFATGGSSAIAADKCRPPARLSEPEDLPGSIAITPPAAPDRHPRPAVDLPRAVAADKRRLLVDPQHERTAWGLEGDDR